MLEAAIRAAREAGCLLVEANRGEIQVDRLERRDVKLAADRESEEVIISAIRERFPNHSILSEECGETGPGDSEYLWVIDPLDGTYNFSRRIPLWCTSIGLVKSGEEMIGVILDPSRDDLFTAEKGRGAFLNGEAMRASPTSDMTRAMIGAAYGPDERFVDQSMAAIDRVSAGVAKVRALGSAALHLAYVACGWMDGFFEFGLHHWDMAAGLVLIREAGGKTTVRRHADGKMDVAVSNATLHDDLLKLIRW